MGTAHRNHREKCKWAQGLKGRQKPQGHQDFLSPSIHVSWDVSSIGLSLVIFLCFPGAKRGKDYYLQLLERKKKYILPTLFLFPNSLGRPLVVLAWVGAPLLDQQRVAKKADIT